MTLRSKPPGLIFLLITSPTYPNNTRDFHQDVTSQSNNFQIFPSKFVSLVA